MKYALLIWVGVWRRPLRTVLTVLSIVVAFLLFGLMQGISSAFGTVQERLRADRLLTTNVSLLPLPYSRLGQIEKVPGIRKVAYAAMLVGNYQNPHNTVVPLAADVRRLFEVFPEWKVSPEVLRAMSSTRIGAIVGSALAARYHWKIGDRVPLTSPTVQADGSAVWTFEIVGLYDAVDSFAGANGFFVNYEYVDEARLLDKGTVVQYLMLIDHASEAGIISSTIDHLFESSPSPTKTESERQSVQSRFNQIGNVAFFVRIILGAVFFALLLLTANTMAQSVRERVPEFASLKAIGFSDGIIAILVIAESATIFIAGAALGLIGSSVFLTKVPVPLLEPRLSAPVLLAAAGMCVLTCAVSTAVPAWRARRLTVIEALRRA